MFRSATTRIAHNTTLPSLGGNKDLRPLQDLITAEKSIVTSLVKLSQDLIKASEALKNWGAGEGEDLGDTMRAATKLLIPFASALSQFATHEQVIRDHMKSVRTREENLAGLKHRRKNVAAKADSAEKKLQKMGSEHKNLQVQTDTLLRLQEEIRELDSEIMTDEAKLGDFKRSATQTWMTLKFGGLQECSEKGLIIADTGKLVMTEIPQDVTQPGSPRAFYTGHERTENYVADALRSINDVAFDGTLSSERVQPRPAPPSNEYSHDSDGTLRLSAAPRDNGSLQNLGMPQPQYGLLNRTNSNLQVDELGTVSSLSDAARSQTYGGPSSIPASSPYASDGLLPNGYQSGSRIGPGGQFATFPVKTHRVLPPSISDSGNGESRASFSEEMDEALRRGIGGSGKAAEARGEARRSVDDPAPTYESLEESREYAAPAGPPPGAAPPAMPQESAYGGYSAAYDGAEVTEPDIQLPYMEPARSERRVRFGSRPIDIRPTSYYDSPVASPLVQPGREEAYNSLNHAPTSPLSPQEHSHEQRAHTPPPDHDDERSVNAAAAREVSREMDALNFSPPPLPREQEQKQEHEPEPAPSVGPPPPLPLSIPSATSSNEPQSSNSPPQPISPFARARDRGSQSPTSPSRLRSPGVSTPPRVPSPRIPSVPASPTQSPLPPPPTISLPPSSFSPTNSFSGSSPYRTPPEYPANGGSPVPPSVSPAVSPSPSYSKGTISPPVPPTGVRTISAAAFRRPLPTPRKTSDASLTALSPLATSNPSEISPLSVKKRGLPSSPYASRIVGGFGGSSQLTSGQAAPQDQQTSQQTSAPPRNQSPAAPADDDQFDYISAYYGSNTDEAEPGRDGLR